MSADARKTGMEHSRGSKGGRGHSTCMLGLANASGLQTNSVGFLTSEPEIKMSQLSAKMLISMLTVMAKTRKTRNPNSTIHTCDR